VGEDAAALPDGQVVRSIKRAITEDRSVVSLPGGSGPREVAADELLVAVLSEIGKRASATLGRPLTDERNLRLGCPAMWNGQQRGRLLTLAAKAGLPIDDSTLVDEPAAAGVAWLTHRFLAYDRRPKGRLLVFDMGGGTLDVAVLDVEGGARPEISVLSALGTARAGDALDDAIAADLTEELLRRGFDAQDSPHPALFRALVHRAAREAKVVLSRLPQQRVVLPASQIGQVPVVTYTREQLEESFRPQLDDAEQLIWAAVRASRLTGRGNRSPAELRTLGPDELRDDIDYVLLTGGMCRIPCIRERIATLFPGAQVLDYVGVYSDEAIVAGLADTTGYDRLNLHRPSFDFVVEWDKGDQLQRETVYAAYTALYEPRQVPNGESELGFTRNGRDFPGPTQGTGRLRIRSASGEPLGLAFDDQVMDGVSLTFGRNMAFKLCCNGRIVIRHGSGETVQLQVQRWPVGSRDDALLVLESVQGAKPPTPWYAERGPESRSVEAAG
jgi:Hsp70 protein